MKNMRHLLSLAFIRSYSRYAALGLAVMACGGGGESEDEPAGQVAVSAKFSEPNSQAGVAGPGSKAAGNYDFGSVSVAPAGGGEVITVYKSPTCGCCKNWVDHLKTNGFQAVAIDREDMPAIKSEKGVPADLHSCHTATIGGYVIEGHVPAQDIRKLLAAKPALAGLAVPGMPVGSPGMEGSRVDPYQVIGYSKSGQRQTFAQH